MTSEDKEIGGEEEADALEERSSAVIDRLYRVEERICALECETRVLEKWISVL